MSRALPQQDHPDPEFAWLAARCAEASPANSLSVATERPPLDWQRLSSLARFHRVEGLVARAIDQKGARGAPDWFVDNSRARARRIAADNLRMVHESARIRDCFAAADIDLLFVKGLTLAALAYGDIGAKAAMDVDILVAPDRIADADRLLRILGYAPIDHRAATSAAIVDWHRKSKESQWLNADLGGVLDLHSRLADNPMLIPGIGLQSPSREVEVVKGITLPTLAPVELAAYLAVHGASSAWFRLKWLADFAALIRAEHPGPLDQLHHSMRRLGTERAANQALLLADQTFGLLSAEPALRDRLKSDPISCSLARLAWREMAGRDEPSEPTQRHFGTATIHRSQFLLSSKPSFLAAETLRQGRLALRKLRKHHR